MAKRPTPVAARFWPKVNKQGPDDCWPWIGGRTTKGYGRVHKEHGPVLAHRLSWELVNGPVPPGMHVLHHCDNPPCVNPAHLFVGTQMDNLIDMKAKGRSPRSTGDHNGKSKITEAEAVEMRRLWSTGAVLQKDLAAAYGLHAAHVSRIVNGKRR